jgi:NAD-dependent SIR2 family protein deacetylase
VLTGAGISTASGIPDYRGPGTLSRARNPIQYREFIRSELARRRYWARSLIGFPRVTAARPNPGHEVLARFASGGLLTGLITQNVDGLHVTAGSEELIELHGRLREAVCLSCGLVTCRHALQEALLARNPDFRAATAEQAPDGDADVTDERLADFRVVDCASCGGPLKPHVVFFGENVPKPRVDAAFGYVDAAASLLVIGSSLTVYSGLRFVRRAAERALPVAIVNLGATRGDSLATLTIDAHSSEVLQALEHALRPGVVAS